MLARDLEPAQHEVTVTYASDQGAGGCRVSGPIGSGGHAPEAPRRRWQLSVFWGLGSVFYVLCSVFCVVKIINLLMIPIASWIVHGRMDGKQRDHHKHKCPKSPSRRTMFAQK